MLFYFACYFAGVYIILFYVNDTHSPLVWRAIIYYLCYIIWITTCMAFQLACGAQTFQNVTHAKQKSMRPCTTTPGWIFKKIVHPVVADVVAPVIAPRNDEPVHVRELAKRRRPHEWGERVAIVKTPRLGQINATLTKDYIPVIMHVMFPPVTNYARNLTDSKVLVAIRKTRNEFVLDKVLEMLQHSTEATYNECGRCFNNSFRLVKRRKSW